MKYGLLLVIFVKQSIGFSLRVWKDKQIFLLDNLLRLGFPSFLIDIAKFLLIHLRKALRTILELQRKCKGHDREGSNSLGENFPISWLFLVKS